MQFPNRIFLRQVTAVTLMVSAITFGAPREAWANKTESHARPSGPLPAAIVSAAELKSLLDRRAVTVLDTRELLQSDQKTPNFEAGHIPGALPAPYSRFRASQDNPGQPPSAERLSEIASQLGLRPEMPIVLTGSGSDPTEFGGVARVYWNLKLAGFQQLAILNGGFGAWLAAGYPVQTGSARLARRPVRLSQDPALLLTTQSLSASLQTSDKPLLIDARPEDFFLGDTRHPAAARWGTLPSAKHIDSEEWFTPNTGRLLPRVELQKLAQDFGINSQRPVVAFCNTGHWAATQWFVLSEVLGFSQVKLYPESIVAWSRAALPMDNEPSRAIALLRQTQGKGIQN
ncbi:MAG: sulfurtransferase [Burkholderiaceae bacterium]